MACHSQQEIAEAVGYAVGPVSEFVNSIPNVGNGTDAISDVSSENPELANEAEAREFAPRPRARGENPC